MPTNVLGTELKCCCRDPITGFYRDGYCRTGPEDVGQHTVCVKVTEEFLDFSVLDGNDLVTPRPEWGFPGLKPGDKWCVCVTRWKSALDHNRAAPVDLEATHASALEFVMLEELKAHALKEGSARVSRAGGRVPRSRTFRVCFRLQRRRKFKA